MSVAEPRARVLIRDTLRSAWRKPERLSGSVWAEKHRRIVDKYAAEKGPWRNDRVPYLTEIMDTFTDPRVRKVAVMKAEQVGGTEALLNYLLRSVHQDPGPTIWVWPTEDAAGKFCRERAIPTFKGCAAIAPHFTERKQDVQTLKLTFDRMNLDFAGSNSPIAIESFPRRDVIVDELDRCAEEIVDAVIGRMTTFEGREKLLLNGRPDDEDEGIDEAYKGGDRREFYVPCPRCGVYHIRTFANVKWVGSTDADSELVKKTAWFRCPAPGCEKPIHAHENMWQLRRGVWCPEGQTVNRDGKIEGEKARPNAYPSFWIRGLLNPFVMNPYGNIAAEFVENKGQRTRDWQTRRLGEPYSDNGARIESKELRALAPLIERGGYKMGIAPVVIERSGGNEVVAGGVLGITAFCDVQQDCLWLEVLGWGAGGRAKWLLDWVKLPREAKDGLKHLWPCLLKKYARVELATGRVIDEMPIVASFIDSGEGNVTDEIYDAVRSKSRGGWTIGGDEFKGRVGGEVWATKGHFHEGSTRAGAVQFSWTAVERGQVREGHRPSADEYQGVELLVINTHTFKSQVRNDLIASLRGVRQAAAEKRLCLEEEVPCRFPEDAPPDYFEQLTSEELVDKLVDGRKKWKWKRRPGRLHNHALDCRVGNLCGGRARGVETLATGQVIAAVTATAEGSPAPEAVRPVRMDTNKRGWMSGHR